ncbi:MAG: flagellar M-ring protein FliF [Synergistaceae bacterium]|jgi:flagellar M-ring protein FliF|nr:flagellar M-ring protein FliF [Synergistaceae bacterium]
MENLKQLLSRFLLFWAGLKSWQKASLFAAVFLVVGLLGMMIFWAGRTVYVPLFSGLEMTDQAAIVTYLRENKIPYQLNPAAAAILLPRNQVDEARLSLAQEGLPKGGGVGFEIFDQSKMGMSEFQQRINYVRALEGELQRTIARMDVVDDVVVNLVLPRQQLFLEQQQPSTASVLVGLKPGAQLGLSQIKAILHLVSRSVDGLQPENVTVVDTAGRVLSDMVADEMIIYSPDGSNSVTSVQRELERQREKELARDVRVMLERPFGQGNVVVSIKVDLNFDKRTNTSREFYPDQETRQGVPVSRQTMEESYTGQQQPTGGQPGTQTNIPGYSVNEQNTESEYNKTETTTNYEITSRESSEVITPGGIKRLTAAVLVDDALSKLSEEDLADVRELTAHAIGYDDARGDKVVVKAMRFSTVLADSLAAELQKDRLLRVITGSVIALAVLTGVGLTGYWWWRRRKARLALDTVQKESKHVPTIQEMLMSPDLLAFQGEMAVLEEQLKAYARNNPSEVANLVNEWLSPEA